MVGNAELRLLREKQLRNMVTMVSQKAHIFNGTLRDNLLIAHPEGDDEQLRDALQKAQLAEFVDGLPDGLDTVELLFLDADVAPGPGLIADLERALAPDDEA